MEVVKWAASCLERAWARVEGGEEGILAAAVGRRWEAGSGDRGARADADADDAGRWCWRVGGGGRAGAAALAMRGRLNGCRARAVRAARARGGDMQHAFGIDAGGMGRTGGF